MSLSCSRCESNIVLTKRPQQCCVTGMTNTGNIRTCKQGMMWTEYLVTHITDTDNGDVIPIKQSYSNVICIGDSSEEAIASNLMPSLTPKSVLVIDLTHFPTVLATSDTRDQHIVHATNTGGLEFRTILLREYDSDRSEGILTIVTNVNVSGSIVKYIKL